MQLTDTEPVTGSDIIKLVKIIGTLANETENLTEIVHLISHRLDSLETQLDTLHNKMRLADKHKSEFPTDKEIQDAKDYTFIGNPCKSSPAPPDSNGRA